MLTSIQPRPRRLRPLFLNRAELGLLALAIGLRLPGLLRPLFLDEYASLEVLAQPTWSAAMHTLRADTHFPGYFALLILWAKVSQETMWLRVLSCVFDMATLWSLWRMCRQRYPNATVFAIALWGSNPVALRFAVEIRPYSLLALVSVLSLWAGLATLERPQVKRVCMLAVIWAALIGVHPVGIMVVAAIVTALGIDVLFREPRPGALRPHYWLKAKLHQGALLLPALLIAIALFAALHWGFTLDPSGARISWMPKMSWPLFRRILNYCFGFDEGAPVALLGQVGPSDSILGVAMIGLGLAIGFCGRKGRPWALAGMLQILTVVLFSLIGTPIFWYRSIFPAIVFTVIAASIGTSHWRLRWGVLGVGPLLLWQTAIWLPRATRPIDPTQQAAQRALALKLPGESVCVFPDWMYQTVRPYLTLTQWRQVSTCTQPAAKASEQHAVGIVRCNLDLLDGPQGLKTQLATMRQHNIAVHDFFVFLDDDDDMYQQAQVRRQILLDAITTIAGPCRASHTKQRVAQLSCP